MRNVLLLSFHLTVAVALSAGQAVPLGHPDFYPSPERPLGWRGDGTGAWPGATCVTAWNAETGENIVWKTATPGAGLCQPIVVGEKVFVTADPNLLLCYNVPDGKLLWQTAIDHTLCMNEADRKAAREEQAFFDGKWKEYCEWRRASVKLEGGILKLSGVGPEPDRRKDKTAFAKWEQSRREALQDLYPSGFNGKDKRLVEPKDPGYDVVLKRLKDSADLAALFTQLVTTQQTHCWRMDDGNDNCWMIHLDKGRGGEPGAPYGKRYSEAQKKYDVWFTPGNNWIGFVTYSFATPITDGKYVYVTTANNAVAAVDLNGKIAWIIWEHRPDRAGNMGTQYVASPALLDDRLVVSQMGLLRAYDASNGKKLWEIWGQSAVANGSTRRPANYYWRGDPESSSPVVGHLSLPDGKRLGIVSVIHEGDSGSNLWRLDDGKLLLAGKGILGTTNAGATPILQREKGILIGSDRVVQLRATNRDTVVTELLWEGKDMIKFSSRCLLDDRFYTGNPERGKGPVAAFDVHTGKVLWTSKGGGFGYYNSPIIAGKRQYVIAKGNDRSTGIGVITDLDNGSGSAVAVAFSDNCATDGDFGYGRTPFQQNSSPSAQANRLFFRSRGMLWCFGDPKQPFPAPRVCPAEARVGK